MKRKSIGVIISVGVFLSVLAALAIAAQDKYTLSVPNGLAFSDFRGYENWQVVAVSQTEDLLKVMVAKLPSFCRQSMGSLFLSSRRVNLLFCGCSSIRANRRFFAAIRCLI